MNRRNFIQAILGSVAAAAAMSELDPERLLWKPGTKTIFLPSPKPVELAQVIVNGKAAFGGRFSILMSGEAYRHAIDNRDRMGMWDRVSVMTDDGRVTGKDRAALHQDLQARILRHEAQGAARERTVLVEHRIGDDDAPRRS